ncbi:MAG: methyltransferase [Nitrospirae bacterium GWC2_57_9]|nr:MAG: methyltransferase [Nitrospirae bacterium GWC2_57_9]
MQHVATRLPSRRKQWFLFARNFFRHPKMLGSLIPSSRFLIGRLVRLIDWGQARVIVEYGPGVGNFTGEILRLMRPDALLIAVETNPEFVEFLRRSFPDPRLRVVHGSAADVEKVLAESGIVRADYVVSGIPLSTIRDCEREEILLSTHRVLQPEGALLVYQFSPKVLPDLRRIYSRVTRSFEPLNVLPAQVFYCAP